MCGTATPKHSAEYGQSGLVDDDSRSGTLASDHTLPYERRNFIRQLIIMPQPDMASSRVDDEPGAGDARRNEAGGICRAEPVILCGGDEGRPIVMAARSMSDGGAACCPSLSMPRLRALTGLISRRMRRARSRSAGETPAGVSGRWPAVSR